MGLNLNPSFPEDERKKLFYYSLYAFGGPTVLVAIAGAVEFSPSSHPDEIYKIVSQTHHMGRCPFFGTSGAFGVILWPKLLILVANVIFFSLTSRELLQHAKDTAHLQKNQEQRQTLGLYIKLFFLMGLTWLVVLFGYIFMKTKVFLLIATILESVQGVFIFFIVCKKDTMQYMRRTSQEWFSRFRQRAESSSSTGGTVESQSTQP
ncbi:unnamed protein product [Darwinula stevensoni]|uniref:G-protein coupled receptors family 2 profile 2 domain-containing protein n=1 Tax=Darwinula stevensoni TaxID=69355 RepID=A0A7R8XIE5_9CRUS|nr:unnamed protein product [Darwinula stevensoni]CAG0893780.1 unnamed protein product [Darwinula stevensoni]